MEWKRHCPKCGKEITYRNVRSFQYAERKHANCVSCGKKGIKCPWVAKQNTERIWSKKSLQKISKRVRGKGNPNFGGQYGFRNHKHSEDAKQKQSFARKKFWSAVKGVSIDKLHDDWSAWKKYRREVDRLTRKQPIHLLENFDKRGTAGKLGAYHLDHIVSVYKGFKQSIPPEKIASMDNLQMIPWMDNQRKGWK